MISSLKRIAPVFCLACLASAARAVEQPASIHDDAGLFHADAIARAELRIDDIRHTFGRNLFVRTVSSIAPHEWRHFWFLKTRRVNRILDEQAQKLADEAGMDGIYVVICKTPRDVHVVVRPGDDPLFGRRDAEALRKSVARRLPEDGPDRTLLALVEQVRTTLQTHKTRGPSASGLSEFTLLAILGGGVALWLVLSLIRYKRRAAPPIEEDAAEQSRRTPALLGAMFGSPSGLCIYDKLYLCSTGTPKTPPVSEGEVTAKTDEPEHPADERPEDAPMVP
jgi:hypothetical protein